MGALRSGRRVSRTPPARPAEDQRIMRIAATADLHFTPAQHQLLLEQLNRVRDEADIFVLAGDLTNFGKPEEMEPLLNVIVRSRVPTVAVLGNHDYESGRQGELIRMMSAAGIKVL